MTLEPPLQKAQVAELSEARAYASLLAGCGEPGCRATWLGDVLLLQATAAAGAFIVNRVLGLGVCRPVAPDMLGQIDAHYADAAHAIELVPAAVSESLRAWLKVRGFRRTLPSVILIREGGFPPPHHAVWAGQTGMSVQPVGVAQAAEVASICMRNFRLPAGVERIIAQGCHAPGWRRWLAMDAGQAVGAALSYIEGGVAWLGWMSVLAPHRGRGVQGAMVARMLEDAASAGCSFVTTETAASPPGHASAAHRSMLRLGFEDVHLRTSYLKPLRVLRQGQPA